MAIPGKITLVFTAIVEFFKIFGPLLTTLVKGLNSLIIFFVDLVVLRTKRLRDQVNHEREMQRRALAEQSAKEQANVAAFKSLVEESWVVRYNDILEMIRKEDYTGVLTLTDDYDNEVVDQILFDTNTSPEYRAMKIVKRMKSEDKGTM